MIISKLIIYYKDILRKNNSLYFSEGFKKQKDKLDSLSEPKDLIERSYNQYLCQIYRLPIILRMLQSVVALPVIIYILLKVYQDNSLYGSQEKNVAVFLREGVDLNLIPKTLINEYTEIIEMPLKGDIYLNWNDKKFIFKYLFNYLKSPFFVLKCLIKIGVYSNVINKYDPKAIITHNEYSFSSSLLTKYSEDMNVEHINIMHGEKLFNIRDSFVQYHKFYVWDDHYTELFIKLRADSDQFKVEKPRKEEKTALTKPYKYELTYYLGGEDEKTLTSLSYHLDQISIPNNKICIRYHPRHTEQKQIVKLFSSFNIQRPQDLQIKESLSDTKYVASLYSTVLYEAFLFGNKLVIDDLSNRIKFKQLLELDYIIFEKEHILLSSLL